MFQCVVVCFSVLQRLAVCCSVLNCVVKLEYDPFPSYIYKVCVAVRCNVLQCVAVCCNMLQDVAVCCSVLQCVAVCRSVLQCVILCAASGSVW